MPEMQFSPSRTFVHTGPQEPGGPTLVVLLNVYVTICSPCGLSIDAGCIDVIFLTDGRSNDPRYDICQEVGCLHRRRGVDTFAIGVGNYNTLRMDCYAENDLALDEYHLFNFPNFTALEDQFELIIRKLINFDPVNPSYLCVNTATDPA